MAKNSTPIKAQKTLKLAAGPACWPYEYEDVDETYALAAILHGNGWVLARHIREAVEIDPRVRRGLAEILNPTSDHPWRLQVIFRFRGRPSKRAKHLKRTFTAAVMPLVMLFSGTDQIDAQCLRTLAEMLDPESDHPLRLDFRQRNRGRPPLGLGHWLSPVPAPIKINPTTLAALRVAQSIREAKKSGRKVPPLKQLLHKYGISRASWYRYRKELSRPIGKNH